MSQRVRRLILGLISILACVAGLLAVSAVVPEVGCSKSTSWFLANSTRLIITVPKQVAAGQSFTINGTLERYTPLLDAFPQQRVTVKSDFFRKTVTTDDLGQFSIQVEAPSPGSYKVVASYDGDQLGYYWDSTDREDLEVAGEIPVRVPSGKPNVSYFVIAVLVVVMVIGCLLFLRVSRSQKMKKEFNILPVVLLGIVILLFIGITVLNLIPHEPPFDYYQYYDNFTLSENDTRISKQIPSYNYSSSVYLTRTILHLPEKTDPGVTVSFEGTLWQIGKTLDTTYTLTDKSIDIWLSPIGDREGDSVVPEKIESITTNKKGNFNGEITFNEAGEYEISAVFKDTSGLYYNSSDVKSVRVGNIIESPFEDWKSPGWLTVFISVPTLVIVIGAFCVYLRYLRKKKYTDGNKKVNNVPVNISVISPPSPPHNATIPVNIGFPQISPEMPDVWGWGDDLLIVFSVDGTPQMLAQYSLDIDLEPGSSLRSPITADGRASQNHIFHQTGQYNIQAVLVKEVRNGYLPASRMVRIVDYREEIVRLYNEMLATLKTQGFSTTSKMTAREVEIRLWKAYPALSVEITKDLIWVFEEANYSLHPIARAAYEIMFMAVQEITKQNKR